MAKKTSQQSAATPVVFADLAFKSRTVILPDGSFFSVENGRITALEPALIAHLDQHADFKRVEE